MHYIVNIVKTYLRYTYYIYYTSDGFGGLFGCLHKLDSYCVAGDSWDKVKLPPNVQQKSLPFVNINLYVVNG